MTKIFDGQTVASRRPWIPYVLVTLALFGVFVLAAVEGYIAFKNWIDKPPSRMVVAANFKKELNALGGWENVEWAWAQDDVLAEEWTRAGDKGWYLVYADHRIGDTLYRFGVNFWYKCPKPSVGVRRADNYNRTNLQGNICFENGSITEIDLENLPPGDRGRISSLAAEIAEAAQRSF